MPMCFKPFDMKSFNPKKRINNYKCIHDIIIKCNIDKEYLIDVIQHTLADSLKLSVIGYNSITQEFCAKKIIKNMYLLHFTLSIKADGYKNSNIIISPSIGSENEIKNVINIITDIVSLF
jgi:hypothetical protein